MNEMLRTFVDFYISVIAREPNQWANGMCMVVLPPFWLFQSANWWAEVPFLPPPRPWAFQVRAEARFQARQLLEGFDSSLARIKAAVPRPYFDIFEASRKSVLQYQKELSISIAKSAPGFLQAKTTIHKNYLERYDVSKRILKTIKLMERISNQCLTDLTSVDSALSYFRQNLGSFTMDNIADTGSIWMSANFRSQLKKTNRSWLKLSGDSVAGLGSENRTNKSVVFEYDLRLVNKFEVVVLRSALGDYCEQNLDRRTIVGGLRTTCHIRRFLKVLAELDISVYDDLPPSWQVRRSEVLQRHRGSTTVDYDSLIEEALRKYRAE